MKKFEKIFELKDNLKIKVARVLLDEEISNKKMISIKNNAFYSIANSISREPLELPRLYVALRFLTGPGDLYYDDYKGSYSFHFMLEVHKNARVSSYLYHLYHYRSYIDFSVRHIVKEVKSNDDRFILHEPNDELFSSDDISYFSEYFFGFSLGFLEGSGYKPQPFIKRSESNLLLFGYDNEEYFFYSYDTWEEYEADYRKISSAIEAHAVRFDRNTH